MTEAYAGIGSRETPPEILAHMTYLGARLADKYILRTGGAPGADQAFQYGAEFADKKVELYLPWKNFEIENMGGMRTVPTLYEPTELAYEIAADFHPSWKFLKRGARMLQARNTHQVLGADCETPAAFVVCWTKNGSTTGMERNCGGTGQALRIAHSYEIPVFNLARHEHLIHFNSRKKHDVRTNRQ